MHFDLMKTIEQYTEQYIPGTSCDAVLLSIRPPMHKCAETDALFEALRSVCHKYGLGTLTPIEAGAV